MKERVLKLDLARTVEIFSTRRWVFYIVDRDRQLVKVEVPISDSERWVVELPYDDEGELTGIVKELDDHRFVGSTIRFVPE